MNALYKIFIVVGLLAIITSCQGCGTATGMIMGAVQGGAKGAKLDMVAAGATVKAMSDKAMATDALNGIGDYAGQGSIEDILGGCY